MCTHTWAGPQQKSAYSSPPPASHKRRLDSPAGPEAKRQYTEPGQPQPDTVFRLLVQARKVRRAALASSSCTDKHISLQFCRCTHLEHHTWSTGLSTSRLWPLSAGGQCHWQGRRHSQADTGGDGRAYPRGGGRAELRRARDCDLFAQRQPPNEQRTGHTSQPSPACEPAAALLGSQRCK